MHEIEPRVRMTRARSAVLLLIVSDGLSVLALLAAGGYLNALNVENHFRVAGEQAPAFWPGLVLAIVLVLSGLTYYWWERGVRRTGGAGQASAFILSWVLMIAALVVQLWISLRLGYSAPYHAYESVVELLSWFSGVHLLLTAFIGLLILGRILRGRIAGHDYIAVTGGYWWYYTVAANLLMWVFILLLA
jgi:hypothetical protein